MTESWYRWTLAILLGLLAAPLLRMLVIRLGNDAHRDVPRDRSPRKSKEGRWDLRLPVATSGRRSSRGGAPPFAVEVTAVLAAVAVVGAAPPLSILLAGLWWIACAVPLIFIDVATHRLPDVLTYSAAGGVLALFTLYAGMSGQWHPLLRTLVVTAVCSGVLLVTALALGRRGLGLGDVKLMISVAMLLSWWGWGTVFLALFVAFLASGAVGVILLATHRATRATHLPMGPFLAGATIAVVGLQALASA